MCWCVFANFINNAGQGLNSPAWQHLGPGNKCTNVLTAFTWILRMLHYCIIIKCMPCYLICLMCVHLRTSLCRFKVQFWNLPVANSVKSLTFMYHLACVSQSKQKCLHFIILGFIKNWDNLLVKNRDSWWHINPK